MSYSLSMNFQFEILRYNLLTMNKLSAERIDELWPPYPQQGPYIVENYTQVPQHILQQERNFQEKEYERLRNEPTSPHRYTHQSQRTSTKTCSLTSSILHKEFTNMQKWRENMFSPRASNNWVVGPQKSTTGKPILCNDPHLGLEIPNVWLLVHLESPTVELVGAALPTMPGVVIGRNKHVGWAVTNVGADVQDLYIVDVDPVDKKFYWSNGAKYEIVERTETILIKDKQPVRPYPL